MTRVDEIKKHYLKSKVFKEDSEFFKAGPTIAYEVQKDFEAIKYAISMLKDYKEYMKDKPKTFGTQNPIFALEALESRINEFKCSEIPNSSKCECSTRYLDHIQTCNAPNCKNRI